MRLKHPRWGIREQFPTKPIAIAAKAMRISDQVGTLEAGKLADLVVLSGNHSKTSRIRARLTRLIGGNRVPQKGTSASTK